MNPLPSNTLVRGPQRLKWLKWLRRTHAWIGLWGAALGLLFGFTGILLNHRAVMKIPAGHNVETQSQVVLETPPDSPQALAGLLGERFGYPAERIRTRREAARDVIWNGQPVHQPERWNLSFDAPERFARAEYWVGNRTVSVKLAEADAVSTLKRLHTGATNDTAWIVLADALAGGLLFLALSGTLLWTRLAGPKLVGAALVLSGSGSAAWVALGGMV
ncbi:MAG: PepSY-associated TM helix domain-containing protein [Bacteroidota bacterium]